MDKKLIAKIAQEFVKNSNYNYISKDVAITEDIAGMKIYDEPIFAFGDVKDSGFKLLKEESIIGEHFLLPEEWLKNANTVITYFFPYTKVVREGNSKDMLWPSNEWLHGRVEGQNFINEFSKHLNLKLNEAGFNSLVPAADSRFKTGNFTSNWSERHVAFVCGLGTLGLSKGIITEKGMAGRLGSIITQLELEPTVKKYKDVYEYCTMCGACGINCPVDAISVESGKDHKKCSDFLNKTGIKFSPRYGCGKCQVSVPCEKGIPGNQ